MSNNQGVWCSKCYGDHYTNDCPEPVAPVEDKEKERCEFCQLFAPLHSSTCFHWEAEPKPTPSEPEMTWVPVYVERAICDLIPDKGYAREIARVAWAWDDEHVGYENYLYRWQNEAIRQRRDLIALQEQIEHERGESQPDSSSIPDEKVWRHLVKRMYDECGSTRADDFIRRVQAGEHDVPSPWIRDSSSISTVTLVCRHCHKPIFADTSYTHDDGDMVCDDGNTCAAPTISTEQTFQEWWNYMMNGSAMHNNEIFRTLAESAWNAAKGKSNGQ